MICGPAAAGAKYAGPLGARASAVRAKAVPIDGRSDQLAEGLEAVEKARLDPVPTTAFNGWSWPRSSSHPPQLWRPSPAAVTQCYAPVKHLNFTLAVRSEVR